MATLTKQNPGGQHTLSVLTDRDFLQVRLSAPGQEPRISNERFDSGALALRGYEQRIRQAQADGFELMRFPVKLDSKRARHEDFEARIVADPHNPEPYLVYADWLTTQGDPRGELITSQHAIDKGLDSREAIRRAQRLRGIYDDQLVALIEAADISAVPPFERLALEWKYGFVRRVKLVHLPANAPPRFPEIRALVHGMLTLPSCRFLQSLVVGPLVYRHRRCDYVEVLYALRDGPFPNLRSLTIGDIPRQRRGAAGGGREENELTANMPIWVGHLEGLDTAVPNLERLFVQGLVALAPLDFPNLRTLDLRPTALDATGVAALTSSKLPRLETFRIWHGNQSARALEGESLTAILEFLAMQTNVRHLGLVNTERTNPLVNVVLDSPLAERLETLDLSCGTLRNAGIDTLARNLDRVPNLKRVDVSYNLLTMRPALLDELQMSYEPQRDSDHNARPMYNLI